MVQQEGPSSLARGLLPNTVCPPHPFWANDQIRAVLMNASQLVSYDFFKDTLLQNGLSNGMPLHILSSALSGTVATTICAPADVVKSRVMNASGNEGPVKLIMESLKKEGPRFLFKGWLPAWSESCFVCQEIAGADKIVRLTPNTICMFVFLEQLRKGVDMFRLPKELEKTIRE